MDHDNLVAEARELAKGKKTQELAQMAFVHAYVANHATRYLESEMRTLKWLLGGIGLTVLAAILKYLLGI